MIHFKKAFLKRLLILLLLSTFLLLLKSTKIKKEKGICIMSQAVETQIINEEELNQGLPHVHSEAALLYEVNTGNILYEKNSEEILYPASTTKIMTAILTVENCNLNETAIVSQEAVKLVPTGYTNAKLIPGESITIKDLLYALMLNSANEAANVLAEHISRFY